MTTEIDDGARADGLDAVNESSRALNAVRDLVGQLGPSRSMAGIDAQDFGMLLDLIAGHLAHGAAGVSGDLDELHRVVQKSVGRG